MGDARFQKSLDTFLRAPNRASALRHMEDEAVVEALAAASRAGQPLVSNVLATEALNRIRRLRASLAHLGSGVVALDVHERILWANPAAERLLGRDRQDMLGRKLAALIHGHDFGLPKVALAKEPASIDEAWVVRSDGRKLCLECTSAPILAPDGDAEGLVVVLSDCTKRKEDDRALRVSEERYRSLFENSLDAIVSMEPDGTITDANPAAEALTSIPVEQARGRQFQEFIHPEDAGRAARLFRAAASFRAVRSQIRILHADGSQILVDAMGIPIVVAGEVVGLHGVARPVKTA